MQSNASAYHFWEHAISMFAGEAIDPIRIEKSGECWKLFSFESRHVL